MQLVREGYFKARIMRNKKNEIIELQKHFAFDKNFENL